LCARDSCDDGAGQGLSPSGTSGDAATIFREEMSMRWSPRAVATLVALLVTLLWSSSYILVKIGLQELPPLTFAGLRYFIGFVSLLALHRLQGGPLPTGLPRRTWRALIALGIVAFAIAPAAIFLSLSLLPVITANLVFQAGIPILVAFSGGLLLGERTTRRQWLGVALTVLGVYLTFPAQLAGSEVAGILLALLAAAAGAASNLLTRYVMRDSHLRALDVTMITVGIGSVLLLAVGVAVEPTPTFSRTTILLLLWLGIVNTALAFTLWNFAMRTLRALEAGVIATAQVIEVTLLAWWLLDEPLSPARLVGALIIVAGVILVQAPRGTPEEAAPVPDDPAAILPAP
jgi:drug/metabolite transporter (DMT)-like permease